MSYRLLIFDMDGTLTEEWLDYAAIRAEIGLSADHPILEQIGRMPAAEQTRARAILDKHELHAAGQCVAREGAEKLLAELRGRGLRTALLTRNSIPCTRLILSRHGFTGHLEHISTREDEPHKPHPDAILNITRKMEILPAQTLMVGDYLYDVQTAVAANVHCALLCPETDKPLPAFAAQATYVLTALRQLLDILDGRPLSGHPKNGHGTAAAQVGSRG